MVDLITEGYLTEFSNEFGISDLAEEDRFEHLAAWLTTRRHYSETTFSPAELVTGSGGDTGIDAIGVIVNDRLSSERRCRNEAGYSGHRAHRLNRERLDP
jgi:hypothetical protein